MAMADLGAAGTSEVQCTTLLHSIVAFLFNLVPTIAISRRTKRTTDVDVELGISTSSTESPSNMAPTSQTFSIIAPSAAQVASTTDRHPHRLSSYHVQDHEKGPSRIQRSRNKAKEKSRSAFERIKNLFRKKHVLEISAPTDFVHIEGVAVEPPNERSNSTGTVLTETIRDQPRPKSWVVHEVPLDVHDDAQGSETAAARPSVIWQLPVVQGVDVPRTPASGLSAVSTLPSPNMNTSWLDLDRPESIASSTPSTAAPAKFPVKKIYENGLARGPVREDSQKAREAFTGTLDGLPKGPIRTSKVPPMPSHIQLTKKRRPQSSPPKVSVNLSQFDPHISGFDDPRETYYPGKYTQSYSALSEVTNAADKEIGKNRTAALDALEGSSAEVMEPAQTSSPPVKPPPKDKTLAYTSKNIAVGPHGSLYFPYNGAFDKFNPYGSADSPRASSSLLPADIDDSNSSRPSTAATTVSSPGIAFTSDGDKRISELVKKVEEDIFTGGIPLFPDDGPEPGSEEYLRNVYRNPPAPPPPAAAAAVPAPVCDTLKVPVPARKPVGSFSKPRALAPATADVDVNKSLPPSPDPTSPRCFTPQPDPGPSRFPPRTDRLADRELNPPAAEQPKHYSMNDNGLPVLDRAAAKRWSETPGYAQRGPMNEMEKRAREYALNRQNSIEEAEAKAAKKAALKAEKVRIKEAKEVRRKTEKDERAARKACGLL